ncbi:MAG: tetratricopeptide repeat protein [Clostridiales bacterium]|nr:tetratricopeptide repeat protein [Clostridiales bacterium]
MDERTYSRRVANAYYNVGLEKAKYRDLSGAAAALKRSLRFDKFHTDARNLLGLIYYEVGETGAALAQWVISLNLQETDNLAEEYLGRLRKEKGFLELADQAAKKYNQALAYAQNDNADLAVLLLMHMLDELPNFVRAQELLALLYITHEDYAKAGRCLYQALKVDAYNPTAQRYMTIVKQNTSRADVEKRKLKNAFSHRQMQDDDIIMPPSYKENTGWQSVLNILVGLLLGAAVIYFLVMPASRESMNRAHNQEMIANLETINQKNLAIDNLNRQLEDAAAAQRRAEEELETLLDDNGGVLGQYRSLIQILQAYRDGDLGAAALLYVDLDTSVLYDGVVDATVDWIAQDMAENGHLALEQLGDTAADGGNTEQAITYYQKSLQIRGDNTAALYKLGMAYQSKGDTDAANECFGEIIMNYPESEYVSAAREQRGY